MITLSNQLDTLTHPLTPSSYLVPHTPVVPAYSSFDIQRRLHLSRHPVCVVRVRLSASAVIVFAVHGVRSICVCPISYPVLSYPALAEDRDYQTYSSSSPFFRLLGFCFFLVSFYSSTPLFSSLLLLFSSSPLIPFSILFFSSPFSLLLPFFSHLDFVIVSSVLLGHRQPLSFLSLRLKTSPFFAFTLLSRRPLALHSFRPSLQTPTF